MAKYVLVNRLTEKAESGEMTFVEALLAARKVDPRYSERYIAKCLVRLEVEQWLPWFRIRRVS